MSSDKTSRVIVLGQGIAGLCAALVLGEAGYAVTLLGRRYPAAGGLQLSPNGVAALSALGLDTALLNTSVPLKSVLIKSLSANRHLTEIIHKPGRVHAAVARQDVLDLLWRTAETIPQLRLIEADLETLHLDEGCARVVTSTGDIFSADEVIGADGANGLARAALTGQKRDSRNAEYRAMRAEAEASLLPAALRRPSTMLMLGDGCHLVSYPLAGGRNNLVFCAAASKLGPGWQQRFFSENPVFSALCSPEIRWADTPLFPAQTLPVWRRPRLTLVGDAAHVMPPHLAQGAGQTFIDMACLKSELADKPLAEALSRMAAIRSGQVAGIIRKAATSGQVMRLGGAAGRARNIFIDLAGPRFLKTWMKEVWETEL